MRVIRIKRGDSLHFLPWADNRAVVGKRKRTGPELNH